MSLKTLERRIERYNKLAEDARVASNKANQEKTKLKNEFTEFLRENEYPVGTQVRYEDKLFSYARTEAEVIPPEKWLEMFEKKKISREQFLDALSVGKTRANQIIGADQVKAIEQIVMGDKADLRIVKCKPDKDAVKVEVIRPITKIRTRKRPYANIKQRSKIKRKIKLRG